MSRVLVLVWNNFTNDKRVLQVSLSLRKQGHDLRLIASKETKGLQRYENIPVKQSDNSELTIPVIRIPLFSSLYSKGKGSKTQSATASARQDGKSLIKSLQNNKFRLIITAFLNWFCFNAGTLLSGIVYRPQIVYCNDLNTLTAGYLISRICRSKVIYDSHEIWLSGSNYQSATMLRRFMWRRLEKILIRKADTVITTNDMRAQLLEEKYKITGVKVIRNTPYYQDVSRRELLRKNIPDEAVLFLYCGALTLERGVLTILEIIADVPGAYLFFMGNGSAESMIRSEVEKRNLSDRVFLRGAVPPLQVIEYASSADVGLQLLPNININHYSTISNKLLEYIMAGCAVIASDFPEIRKIVAGNDLGILVDPEDKQAIRDACVLLSEDKEKLKSYRANSVKAKKQYCWEKDEHVLQEIIAGLCRV